MRACTHTHMHTHARTCSLPPAPCLRLARLVFDVLRAAEISRLTGHGGAVTGVAVCDARRVATACQDGAADRHRQRQRQTDRDRQRQRQTNRAANASNFPHMHTHRHTHRHTCTHTDTHTDTHTHIHSRHSSVWRRFGSPQLFACNANRQSAGV